MEKSLNCVFEFLWEPCVEYSHPYFLSVCLRALKYFLTFLYCFQWHLGMFANQYLPTFRGFESHYGYYQGCEDFYDHTYEADLVRSVTSHKFN